MRLNTFCECTKCLFRPLNKETGSAMTFVLVITLVLLSGAVWAVGTYRDGVLATTQLRDKLLARTENESIFQLLQYYGSTGLFSQASVSNFLPEEIGLPEVLPLDGHKISIRGNSGKNTVISLQDSAGCLNLLFTPIGTLAQFLRGYAIPEEDVITIIDSLMDWRDKDDFHHANGAEAWYYSHEKKANYGPRNSLFIQNSMELGLLKGMKPEYLQRILPVLTLSPGEEFNVQTMSAFVLAAFLNCSVSEADRIVALRKSKGYLTRNDLRTILGERFTIVNIKGLGFPSKVVRVSLETVIGDARTTMQGEISFVEDRFGPYRVLTWREGGGQWQ